MKMRITISLITLLLFGCASNLPYTDIDDVMRLDYGMSQSKVEYILGPPVKVRGTITEEIWLFDYRTLENTRFEWIPPIKGDSPTVVKGASEFYCVFEDGRLIEYGSCITGCDDKIASMRSKKPGLLSKISKYKYPILGGVVLFGIISAISSNSSEDSDDDGYCTNMSYTNQNDCEMYGYNWYYYNN